MKRNNFNLLNPLNLTSYEHNDRRRSTGDPMRQFTPRGKSSSKENEPKTQDERLLLKFDFLNKVSHKVKKGPVRQIGLENLREDKFFPTETSPRSQRSKRPKVTRATNSNIKPIPKLFITPRKDTSQETSQEKSNFSSNQRLQNVLQLKEQIPKLLSLNELDLNTMSPLLPDKVKPFSLTNTAAKPASISHGTNITPRDFTKVNTNVTPRGVPKLLLGSVQKYRQESPAEDYMFITRVENYGKKKPVVSNESISRQVNITGEISNRTHGKRVLKRPITGVRNRSTGKYEEHLITRRQTIESVSFADIWTQRALLSHRMSREETPDLDFTGRKQNK